MTMEAYAQIPHLDVVEDNVHWRNKTWFLHIPLQKEGMVLSIFDDIHREHKYILIPFGTCLLLRSDVIHSGVYGGTGNLRLHLVLWKLVPDAEETNRLERKPGLDLVFGRRTGKDDWREQTEDQNTKMEEYVLWYIDCMRSFCPSLSESFFFNIHDTSLPSVDRPVKEKIRKSTQGKAKKLKSPETNSCHTRSRIMGADGRRLWE